MTDPVGPKRSAPIRVSQPAEAKPGTAAAPSKPGPSAAKAQRDSFDAPQPSAPVSLGGPLTTPSAPATPPRDVIGGQPTTSAPATLTAWFERLAATPQDVGALPPELARNVDFLRAVVERQPAVYPFLDDSLRSDMALAGAYLMRATRRPDGTADAEPLKHLPVSLLARPDLQNQAFSSFDTLAWLPPALRTPEVLSRAIERRPTFLTQVTAAEGQALPNEQTRTAWELLQHPDRAVELAARVPAGVGLAFLASPELVSRVPLASWAVDAVFHAYSQAHPNDARTAVRSDALARIPEAGRLALIERSPSAVLIADGVSWLPAKYQAPEMLEYVVQQRPALVRTLPAPLATNPDFLARVTTEATVRAMSDAQLAAAPAHPSVRLERLARRPSLLDPTDVATAKELAARSPEATRDFPAALRNDRSVMAAAIRASRGRALEWAGPAVRDDVGLVADVVADEPSAFAFASHRLRADPAFVRQLLPLAAEHPLRSALAHAAPELRASRAFAESMVDQYGALLGELDASLRADPLLAKRALRSSLEAINGLSAPIDDKALMLELVAKNGSYLVKGSPQLKADPQVVEAAIRTAPLMGPPASMPEPDRTRLDLLAVARWPLRIKFFDPADPRTATLLEAAAEADARVLGLVDRAEVPAGVRQALAALAAKRPELARAAAALSARFDAQGIKRPERLGFPDTALQLLAAREENVPDGRPLAIAVYSPDDWNGALSSGHVEALARGYRVLYFEANQDDGLVSALTRGTSAQKAELILLAGHGSRQRMALGADDPQAAAKVAPEALYLDTSDEAQVRAANLDERLEAGARVVLVSCSTGRGAPGDNVAGMLARALPSARIIAPMVSTNEVIQVDAAGKFLDAGYEAGAGFTLELPPRG